MIKTTHLLAAFAATLLLCLAMNAAFYSKIGSRFDTVDSKLIEVDGRRNAQYGIIKNEIKYKLCEVAK
jgi:hypothetical protein